MKLALGRHRLTSADGSGLATNRAPRPEDIQALGAEVFRHLMLYGNVVARRSEAGEIELVDPTSVELPSPDAVVMGAVPVDAIVAVLVAWGMSDEDIATILYRCEQEMT